MSKTERVNELLQLIKDNPELKIVPMVYHEIVGEDHSYWIGSWGKAEIDEVYHGDERIYFRSVDEENMIEEQADVIFDDMFPNVMQLDDNQAEMVSQKAKEKVNNLKWEKAIVVRIEMP